MWRLSATLHTSHLKWDFSRIRSGLNWMINCFIFVWLPSTVTVTALQRAFQQWHTVLCIHMFVSAKASILFSIWLWRLTFFFAWLLSPFKVGQRREDRGELCVSFVSLTDTHTHTHLLVAFWRVSKHLLQSRMERRVHKWSETSLICVERDLATPKRAHFKGV